MKWQKYFGHFAIFNCLSEKNLEDFNTEIFRVLSKDKVDREHSN